MTVDLDWENLGFAYHKLPFRYISYYKDGQWDDGQLTEDATLHISEASPALHYGQQAFEGLKLLSHKDGSVQLFRPNMNADCCNAQQTAFLCHKCQLKNSLMPLSKLCAPMKNSSHHMVQVQHFISVHC